MASIVVIAKISVVIGQAQKIKPELKKIIQHTLEEDGCIQYDCHQDVDDPHQFYFYEIWKSKAHLTAHSQSPHIKAFGATTNDMIAGFEMSVMKKLQ